MNRRVKINIKGKVQGVWYRASAKEEADKLGITGWVKNEIDGSVTVVAEGDEEKLNEFIKWCWIGPVYAKVENIKEEWSEFKGEFKVFKITY